MGRQIVEDQHKKKIKGCIFINLPEQGRP